MPSIYDVKNVTRDPGMRPLPEGMRCQQPGFCNRAEKTEGCHIEKWPNARLTEEEREHPATCALCKRVLCDYCAAGVKIPASAFVAKGLPAGPYAAYDGFVCSEHFNEEWV